MLNKRVKYKVLKNLKLFKDLFRIFIKILYKIYSESERSSASNTVISQGKFGFGSTAHLSFGFFLEITLQ